MSAVKSSHTNKILLDTDVFSYLFGKKKNQPDLSKTVSGKITYITFVTLGEAFFGAIDAGWGPTRIENLKQELGRHIVIYPDYATCIIYSNIKSECLSQGRPSGEQDYWVAATALARNIPLLTNNRKHFEKISNLEMVNF
jgi:tRNA(fMet)-specific endonuclease VapC